MTESNDVLSVCACVSDNSPWLSQTHTYAYTCTHTPGSPVSLLLKDFLKYPLIVLLWAFAKQNDVIFSASSLWHFNKRAHSHTCTHKQTNGRTNRMKAASSSFLQPCVCVYPVLRLTVGINHDSFYVITLSACVSPCVCVCTCISIVSLAAIQSLTYGSKEQYACKFTYNTLSQTLLTHQP